MKTEKRSLFWTLAMVLAALALGVLLLTALSPAAYADYEDGMECPICGKWRWDDYIACYDCGTCEDCIDPDSHFCSDCECCIVVDGGDFCEGCWRCEDCCDETACPECRGSCVKCETNGVSCGNCWLCGDCNDETVCPDCGESCVKCEAGGVHCGNCWYCSNCNGDSVCPDCGESCNQCNANEQCEHCWYCVDHSGMVCVLCHQTCLHCDNIIMCHDCEICADCSGGVCDNCENACVLCSTLCENCTKCLDCNDGTVCPDCNGTCLECGFTPQCETCYTCADCAPLCESCEQVCAACDDEFCLSCNTCSACNGGTTCTGCYDTCGNCGNKPQCESCWYCLEEVTLCQNCGEICADCDSDFCLGCETCSSCNGGTTCPDCWETCADCGSKAQCQDCWLCEDDTTLCQDCREICIDCGDSGWCFACDTCENCNGDTACPDCQETCGQCKAKDQCRDCRICEDCGVLCRNCGEICLGCDPGFNSALRLCADCEKDDEVPRLAIITQPQAYNVCLPGGSVTVSVTAAGEGLTYQWMAMTAGGTFEAIPGATGPTYTKTNIRESDLTNKNKPPCLPLYCRVRDSAGNTVKSNHANIYVQAERVVFTGLNLPEPGQKFGTTAVCNVGTVGDVRYTAFKNGKADHNVNTAIDNVQPGTEYVIAIGIRYTGGEDIMGPVTPIASLQGLECIAYEEMLGLYYYCFRYTTPASDDILFTGTELPVPGEELDTTLPACTAGKVMNLLWRVGTEEVTGTAQPGTTYKAVFLVSGNFEGTKKRAVWNGIEANQIVYVSGRGTVFEFIYTTPGESGEPAGPAGAPAVTISGDGKTASVTGDLTGLYARVAIILDNNGQSGLYVAQAEIGPDGGIVIPSLAIPGLVVKGVNVALVPTLADVQSRTPTVITSATVMY